MSDGRCSACATELAPNLLVCPACHALVHRERLTSLARDAEAEPDREKALALWRQALALLPAGSRQHDAVTTKIDALTNASSLAEPFLRKLVAPETISSMIISLVVYSFTLGWEIAATLIAAIFIHEMGHVVELRKRRMAAGAPIFVPGLGAFVPMKTRAATPSDDAQVGLAGPLWGFGATLIAVGVFLATRATFWSAITRYTAELNLVNLTPVWQLDGSRGFRGLTRDQRWIVVAIIAVALAVSRERALILVGAAALWRAFEKKDLPPARDWTVFAIYVGLLVAFTGITMFR